MRLCSTRFAVSVFISIGFTVTVPTAWADECPPGTHSHIDATTRKTSCQPAHDHSIAAPQRNITDDADSAPSGMPFMDKFHVANSLASTFLVPFTENVWKSPWLIPHALHTLTELMSSHGKESLVGLIGGGIQSNPVFLLSAFGALTYIAQKKNWSLGGGHDHGSSEDEADHEKELSELEQRIKDLETRLAKPQTPALAQTPNQKLAQTLQPGVRANLSTHQTIRGKVVTWNQSPDSYPVLNEARLQHQARRLEKADNASGITAFVYTQEAAYAGRTQ